MYGTDVGMPIAYVLAADHRDRLERLVVSEAPLPGVTPSPPLFLPPLLNARLWHLAFNQLPAEVNEALVRGREDIFFGAEFDASAGTNKLPKDAVKYHINTLAPDPEALRGSFGFYRAIPTTTAQNQQRKERRLTMPSWPSAARKAPETWSGPRCSSSPTTCRPWSSPAPAIGLPSRRPRSCWRR